MTDVVAVALISAGSSLLAATVGAVTTYKVSRRSSETAIAAAETQRDVELAKVEAENDRLREQHREEERRTRKDTYYRTLAAIQHLHGTTRDADDFAELMREWRYCRAGVQISGSPDALAALDAIYGVVGGVPATRDDPLKATWRKELKEAAMEFIEVVRRDIGDNAIDNR